MAKEVAYMYKINTCLQHMHSSAMTKYVRRNYAIVMKLWILSGYLNIFINNIRNAASGKLPLLLIVEYWSCADHPPV